jgi:hypothetical protein
MSNQRQTGGRTGPAIRPTGMSGRVNDILLHATLLTLPMLVFSGALLGLVFAYRIRPSQSDIDGLGLGSGLYESGVIYVDFSATRLIFIASWSSTAAPLLIGSALILFSYPAAQTLFQSTRASIRASLPTPYQVSLILQMLSGGGVGALWNWFKYLTSWRKTRYSQGRILVNVSAVLVVMTILRYASPRLMQRTVDLSIVSLSS